MILLNDALTYKAVLIISVTEIVPMDEVNSEYRSKILVLGANFVGKTSIIKKFIANSFSETYRETVEDIFSRDFNVAGQTIMVDIYDTNISYPDMRRLRLATAEALIFVFSLDSLNSFLQVKELMKEAAERRKDIDTVPIILVGNKVDIPEIKVDREMVNKWLGISVVKRYTPYLETSAKTGENILEIFRQLLRLSKVKTSSASFFFESPILNSRRNSRQDNFNNADANGSHQPNSRRHQNRLENANDKSSEVVVVAMLAKFNITRHASLKVRRRRSLFKQYVKESDQSDCLIS
ncbi:GTP-binding protein Di-Ras2 [Trichinella patagoniensis]|uniref:GTP-binding protein Di-Ras2 n=1 Tax=Trichinella patagoniensis TaxID=990121 RepID=A0A0V1AEM7_9BILA|nr:GTP-binding protein Di-Ras2 [Trichinella patagoniensis]